MKLAISLILSLVSIWDSMDLSLQLSKYIREKALEMCSSGKSSHIGSIFSCADILAVLYSKILTYKSDQPKYYLRDRFLMSKGHAGAGLYATLSKVGFVEEELLKTHYKNGSFLSGHVCHKIFPGVEFSTGSLGHALPVSIGIALGLKLKNIKSKVFCLMSDGELDEGSNWEAFLSAAHNNLNNLVAIIDRNRLQSIEDTETTLMLEPLKEKFLSFNWNVKIINGHDHEEIYNSLKHDDTKKPTIVIANTVKGKGVSFMENNVLWHYKSPTKDEVIRAKGELN